MFSHYQRRGKCEWRDGRLEEFVLHYNRENGTSYAHTECLDILRTGGRTERRPEVLVTDASTCRQMVVERKSVVWPLSYILRHQNAHDFANAIGQQTKDRFQDDCYELTVSAKQLEKLDNRTVKQIALEIGAVLVGVNASSMPLLSSTPIHWRFHRANVHEHGTRKGIVVIHQDTMTLEDFDRDDAMVGTAATMQRELAEAAAKFTGYEVAHKVVLLDFYGDELSEEDIPPLLHRIAVPQIIDEIWMTKRDWISENDFEIGFGRLFARSR